MTKRSRKQRIRRHYAEPTPMPATTTDDGISISIPSFDWGVGSDSSSSGGDFGGYGGGGDFGGGGADGSW